jgi:hypothetical protein
MSDQPDAETSAWQHTTLTTERNPCPPVRFEPTISANDTSEPRLRPRGHWDRLVFKHSRGTRWRSSLRHCATSQKVAGSIPDDVTWIFYWHSFRPRYGSGVDSAFNRNEYQKYFLGVKAAGACGWQPYSLHVLIVLKSGSLNLMEPSGPVQACNWIALPLSI